MTDISVEIDPAAGGWLARVTVVEDATTARYEVAVTTAELARLAPAAADPADLVRRSFEFLLAREPKEAILPRFGLAVIGRYYPEYDREIGRRNEPG